MAFGRGALRLETMESLPTTSNTGGAGGPTPGAASGPVVKVVALRDDPNLEADLDDALNSLATAQPVPHLVLEFGEVSYIASSHLAQMLRIRKKLNDSRRKLAVCGMNDHIWSVLVLTGLDRVFQSYPNSAAAVTAVTSTGEMAP